MGEGKAALLAKLSEPRPADVFVRARISKLLDAAAERHGLIWVSGPAGAGKTTAIQSWLSARRFTRLWYRVDHGDVDPANLFHYVARTAKRPLPTMSLEVSADAFARRFFEAWFARGPRVLVLDDLHEAHGRLDDVLRSAHRAVPAGALIIVISREPPPATLARAFASREATLIDWSTLRLTRDEAYGVARALTRKGASTPKRSVVDALHELTDGWPVGLALLLAYPDVAALAPLDRVVIARRLRESDGAQRVFDYVANEIFGREAEATRTFLLRSAVLPAFTESWAREITGVAHTRAIVRRLEAGLFIKHYAGTPSVYRYHPLFHAFLLEHAEKLLGEQMIGDLRRRGAALLAGGGQLEAAFDLLVQVGDGPACVELVERAAPQLVGQGRRVTLLDWIALLPEDVVRTSPWLLFWKASCMLGFAPLVSAELLDAAIGQFRSRGQLAGARLAWSARVAACVHAGTDLTPIDHWLDELPALERDAAEVSVGHLLALFRQPGHPQAEAWTREAFERWRSIADPSTRAMTAALLIATYCFSGELGRAAIVLDLLRRGERAGEPEPLAQVTLCNGEAVFAWATADNVGCLAAVQRGLDIAAQTGLIVWNDQLSALGAAATLASGDPDLAEPFISRMREAASRGTRFTIGNHQFYAAWEAALRGDLARARAAIDVAVELADALGYPVAQVTSRIARAHLFLQADKDPQPELAAARAIADASRSPFLGFSCAFAEACITQRDEAIAAALGLGRSLGIYNVFWWLRDRVARLCERALEHGIEPTYVNELIRRHGLTPVEAQTSGAWPYPVRIRSLGGLAIEVDGAPIALPAKGPHVPLRLLAAIIALGGRDVPEARIIEAVWPDADGAGGRTVLQTTLHRLRRLLGNSDALTVRAGVVTLDPQVVWLDMWAVGHACTAIERAVARADHGELVARIDGLLATYGGPLLGDDDSTAVTVAARVRLRDRITRTVIAAGSALEARGERGRARALYEAALERDESAEVLYQRLMTCLERAGEAAEALRLFERCEAALASRLGQGPSKQTREIRERIHRTLAL